MLFERIVDPQLLVRRLNVTACHVLPESMAQKPEEPQQLDLFTDTVKQEELLSLEHTIDGLRNRYGDHVVYSGSYLCADKLSWQRIGFRDHTEIY